MTENELLGRNHLREALKLQNIMCMQENPPDESEYEYSKRYQKNINRIWHPIMKHFDIAQSRIIGFMASVLILLSCTVTVYAARKPIADFFTTIWEGHFEIFFHKEDVGKAPESIETVYTIGILPSGYEKTKISVDRFSAETIWKTDSGEIIELWQYILKGSFTLDSEDSDTKHMELDGLNIVYAEKHGIRIFFWNTDDYKFALYVPSEISVEDSLDMIRSMQENKE